MIYCNRICHSYFHHHVIRKSQSKLNTFDNAQQGTITLRYTLIKKKNNPSLHFFMKLLGETVN